MRGKGFIGFLVTVILLLSGVAHAQLTVTPATGLVNDTIRFELELNTSLSAGRDVRISFGNGIGGWLDWHVMRENSDRTQFRFNRSFSQSGDRKYRFSVFRNNIPVGSIQERTVLIKERPPFLFDSSNVSSVDINKTVRFFSLWERSFNDEAFIQNAKIRYKLRNSGSWQTRSMQYDRADGTRELFDITLSFSQADDYEYQFQASQSKTLNSLQTESDWSRSQFFTVKGSNNVDAPDLTVTAFSLSKTILNAGESFTAFATIKNIGQIATTQRSKVNYYVNKNPGLVISNDYVNRDNVRVLAVGSTDDENDELDAPSIAGSYWVYACADDVLPAELVTTNNCHPAVKITVTEPDPVTRESISITSKPSSDRITSNNFSLVVRGESELGIKKFSMNIQPYGVSSPIANTSQEQSVAGNTTETATFNVDISSLNVGRYEVIVTTTDREPSNGNPVSISYPFYKDPVVTNPKITQIQPSKTTFEVDETAIFIVQLSEPASNVDMSIMPSVDRKVTDTEWYFERVFETAGTKSITFSAKNSLGEIVDTETISVNVIDVLKQYTISILENQHGTVTATGINCPNDCSETYPENTQITFTATPSNNYEFKKWTTNGCSNTPQTPNANKLTITVVENCEITAVYREILPDSLKALDVSIDGQGYAYSVPGGIHCGDNCEQLYETAQAITLRANPDDGWQFKQWSGISACSTEPKCSFELDDNLSVVAEFEPSSDPQLEPRLISFSPESIQQGQATLITFRGKNIPSTFVSNIWGMDEHCRIQSKTSEQVTAWCTGHEVGERRLFAKNKPSSEGGFTINGAENWSIYVTPPPNDAPSVWLASLPKVVYVNEQFGLTVKSEDVNGNLSTVQVDWLDNGDLNRIVRVNDPKGEDIPFAYTPTTSGILKIRFIATDTNGIKGEAVYAVQVDPERLDNASSGIAGGDTFKDNTSDCPIQRVNKSSNPIDPASGAKLEQKQLLRVEGVLPIEFTINYNSLVLERSPVGVGWDFQNSHTARIREENNGDVTVLWSDNSQHLYTHNGDGTFQPSSFGCRLDRLEKLNNGSYKVTRRSRMTYLFNEFHFLTRIENEKGQGIELSYDEQGRLVQSLEPISNAYIQYTYSDSGALQSAKTSNNQQVQFEHDDQGRLLEITHADRVKEAFTYNDIGQILKHTLGKFLLSNTSYDEFGRAKQQDDSRSDNQLLRFAYTETEETITSVVTDKNGNTKTQIFDKNYLLLSETDEVGNKRAYTYNADGRPTSITDGNGNTTTLTYNEFGDVLVTTFADNTTVINQYDERRNLIKRTDQLGQVETYVYDVSNNLLKFTDKAGNTTTYTYNDDNQLTSETTPENRTTQYQYTNGRLTTIIDPLGNSQTRSYDADGRLITETDFAGNPTQYKYDGMGRKIEEVDALGYKQTWSYDARGNMVLYFDQIRHASFDSLTKAIQYSYDTEGNYVATTYARYTDETIDEILTYDGENRLISRTDGGNNITRYIRDKAGRVIKTIDADGNEYETKYDKNDNIISSFTPLGGRMDYLYDPLNRVTQTTDSLGRVSRTQYDSLGRVIKTTDPLNRERISAYSPLSQLTQVTSPGDLVSSESFDKDQLQKSATDPNDNTRTIVRDKNGRIIKETTADGVEITYQYDSRGLVTSMTNGRGETTSYTYDALSRLIERADDVATTRYAYDPSGNLIETTENGTTIARQHFSFRDQITAYSPDSSKPTTIRFGYDIVGNLKTLFYPSSNTSNILGIPIHYTYNSRNLIETVGSFSNNVPYSAQYEYDAKSRLVKTTRGNGSVETRIYDSQDQLIQTKDVDANGKLIVQFDYVYDKLGRLIEENSIPDMMPPASLLKQQASEYSYSDDNRLATQDGKTFDFDGDGNIVHAEGVDLQFNARGQLVQAGDTSYRYDAEGHRIGMTHDGQTTDYLVNPHADLSQTLRINQDRFIYGNGLVALYRSDAEQFYYHYDYRGSVVAMTDQTGEVVQRYGYLPYGKRFPVHLNPQGLSKVASDATGVPDPTVDPVPPVAPPTVPGGSLIGGTLGTRETPPAFDSFKSVFGYNARDGVLTDPNGLYYMRARYYSPDQRRFLSKDPLRGQVGDLASLNRYGYVGGDPVNAIDPSGLNLTGAGSLVPNDKELFIYASSPITIEEISNFSESLSIKIEATSKHKVVKFVGKALGNLGVVLDLKQALNTESPTYNCFKVISTELVCSTTTAAITVPSVAFETVVLGNEIPIYSAASAVAINELCENTFESGFYELEKISTDVKYEINRYSTMDIIEVLRSHGAF